MTNITKLIQTKTQANKLIKTIQKELDKVSQNIISSKWAQAELLHKLKVAVPWKITKYINFTAYRKAEIKLSEVSIMKYIRAHEDLIRLGFTQNQLSKLSQHFSFTTLSSIFKVLDKKQSITSLISEYAKLPAFKVEKLKKNSTGIESTSKMQIELNDNYMKRFTSILTTYGMHTTPNNHRVGVTASIMALIDDIQP